MHSVWRHHVHSAAAVLVHYSVISVSYFNYLMMASETPRVSAMFGCKFIPGVKKCYHSFPKNAILRNIWVKKCRRSDGVNPNTTRTCSLYFSYPFKYVLFNLVTLNVKYKPSVNTKHKFGWLKLTRICMTNAKLYKLTKGEVKEYYKNYNNSK